MEKRKRTKEFGKAIPRQTTINQELSTLRRCFTEVAVTNGFLTRDSVPEIPSVKLPKDKKHRRDDLTAKEWEEMEKVMRYYWTKGKTKLLDEEYNTEKDSAGNTRSYGMSEERESNELKEENDKSSTERCSTG